MKKIIINGRFLMHRITGVERYAREILMEFDKIVEPGQFEVAVPVDVTEIPSYKNIKVVQIGKLRNRLWEHISFPIYVMKRNAISLNLCNVAPILSPGIVCIHDVKIKATPQYFSKKFLFWYRLLFSNEIKRAKAIITVSEFSKSEIIKYYKADEKKINVISNAWQHFERIDFDKNALEKYGLKSKEYYFSMCSLEPNKNFKWIAEVAKRNKNEIFAVSGSVNSSVFNNEIGTEDVANVKFLGYVSDEEAKTLMQECKAFLYPTFYEGFGIPPLEAMSTGAQVIVSDNPCMQEVLEDAVVYIDPYKYDVCINSLLEKKFTEEKLILEKYSWVESAQELLSLLRSIVDEKN